MGAMHLIAIAAAALNAAEVGAECVRFLREQEGVAYAFAMDEIREAPIPELLRTRSINGDHPQRRGAIQLILKPAWGGDATGESHPAGNP